MAVIGFAAITPPGRLAGAPAVAATMEEVGALLGAGRLYPPR